METFGFADGRLLQKDCWPRMEACYSRTWDHYTMPPHFHNRAEIMYVLKGWCLVHLYDYQPDPATQNVRMGRRRTERLGPGEFILLDQGVLHELEVPEVNYMLNAEFQLVEDAAASLTLGRLAAASPELRSLVERRQRVVRSMDESGLLLKALEQAILEFSRGAPKNQALADVLMAELLLRLAANIKDNAIKANALSYARRAAEYLAGHLSEDVRVADVAKEVGVAVAYLQRVFRQTMGMTMVEYLNQLRVEQSKRMLMFTEEPIMDVAVASGFNSRQHFFRVFSAATGTSPQQFRQAQRARQAQELFLFEDVDDHSYDKNGRKVLQPDNDEM